MKKSYKPQNNPAYHIPYICVHVYNDQKLVCPFTLKPHIHFIYAPYNIIDQPHPIYMYIYIQFTDVYETNKCMYISKLKTFKNIYE